MNFADSEKSLTEGSPYELHELRLGETSTYWRYADAPANIEYDGNTFIAAYCPGGPIEQGVNVIKSRTNVKVNWDNPFAWQYTVCAPDGIVHYTRYKGYGTDVQAIFIGDVLDVVFRQEDRQGRRWAEIVIDPSTAAMQLKGLITRYSRQCQVDLYSDQCGVDRDDYKQLGTLDGVSGNVLESTTFGGESDGYWWGGDIIINGSRRKMVAHAGNYVTILPGITGIAAGDSFDAAPGCNHLPAAGGDCNAIFDNLDDYKGQPNIPDSNPWSPYGFDGSDGGSGDPLRIMI